MRACTIIRRGDRDLAMELSQHRNWSQVFLFPHSGPCAMSPMTTSVVTALAASQQVPLQLSWRFKFHDKCLNVCREDLNLNDRSLNTCRDSCNSTTNVATSWELQIERSLVFLQNSSFPQSLVAITTVWVTVYWILFSTWCIGHHSTNRSAVCWPGRCLALQEWTKPRLQRPWTTRFVSHSLAQDTLLLRNLEHGLYPLPWSKLLQEKDTTWIRRKVFCCVLSWHLYTIAAIIWWYLVHLS